MKLTHAATPETSWNTADSRRLEMKGTPSVATQSMASELYFSKVHTTISVTFLALCRNLEKWPIGGDLKFWPRRLVVEVGLPGCKPESSGDERREMVWKWGRAWCVPARSVVSTTATVLTANDS